MTRRIVRWACSLGLVILAGQVQAAERASVKLGPGLERTLAAAKPDETFLVWVFFTDKGPAELQKAALRPELVTERSLRRRLKVRPPEQVVDATDLPVPEEYVARVAAHALEVRQRSKWFDAVSVRATRAQLASLQDLPIVRSLDLVTRFRRRAEPQQQTPAEKPAARPAPHDGTSSINYGPSLTQLSQIDVPALHDRGITGQGVLVGHFDNGYRLLSHQVFASTQIVATFDFVDHDVDPAPPSGAPSNYGAHGISTLSVLGGYQPGTLVGVAFGAQYVLARTENDASETPLEEDNWVAAIEWADSLGIDVASTSLGYLDYNPPYTSLTWQDMNGNTAVITRAADMAVARGIVVVNSAGNEKFNPDHNTLIAPADGDSVITVGAVTSTGERSSFSSVGPTTDVPPRIKPDVMAMGSSVYVAGTSSTTAYGPSSGTSFSCPLAAGVAALLVSASPAATPMQIRDAMRLTASQAFAPDNLYGWGVLDAVAALNWLQTSGAGDPDVADRGPIPAAYRLEPNLPNPFNPSTRIAYALPEASWVTLRIYDLLGRRVRTLVHETQPSRRYSVLWNGLDDAGRGVPSGVYLYRLDAMRDGPAGSRVFVDQKKMTLVK